MVIQALVLRSSDGLPLSASTDVDRNVPIKDCQKYIKLLSRKLAQLPSRCTLKLTNYNIHVVTLPMGLSFLMLCEELYPSVMAFCFLEDLQREFIATCDYKKVVEAKRAYTFIEFGISIQKLKNSYNRPRTLTTRLNVADMSAELRLRPPYEITEDDIGLGDNGFLKLHKDTHRPVVSADRSLVPMQWFGLTAAGLNFFCALLNVVRGMAFIQHGNLDDEDMGAYTSGATFLLCSCLYIFQVYLMVYMVRWRSLLTVIILFGHLFCIFHLSVYRNTVQTIFYSCVAVVSSAVIVNRQQTQYLPGYCA